MNFKYDESMARNIKYSGIACINGEPLAIGENFDHRPILDNNLIMPMPHLNA